MRGARQRRSPKRRLPARSSRRASSTTTRRSTSTIGSKVVIPADLPPPTADEIRRLSIAAFRAIDGAGMARVDFLLSRGDRRDFRQRGRTRFPGFTTISMYSKLWAAIGRRLPDAARSADRASRSSGTPRSSSSAPASHDARRRVPVLAALCRTALARPGRMVRPPARSPRRRSTPALPPRYELRGEDGLVRVYEFILEARFDQVEAELRRACGPAPPEACDVLERDRALVAHPARSREPRARRRVLGRGRARDPDDRSVDRAQPAGRRRPGSTWAAPTRARVQWRVLRGEKLAAARDGKRIKQALERAIALEPGLDDAYFGIGHVQVLRRRRAGGGQDPAVPAAAARRRSRRRAAQMLRARSRGRLLQGEADYQLHDHLPLVRAAAAPRAWSCCTRCRHAYPAIRCSRRRSPTSRTPTSTTSPPASRPGARCWRPRASSASNNAGARRSAGPARRRAAARGAAPDRPRDRAAAGGDRALKPQDARSRRSRSPICKLGEAHDRLGARAAAVAAYSAVAARAAARSARRARPGRRAPAARAGRDARRGLPPVARRLAAPRAATTCPARRPRSSDRSRSNRDDPVRALPLRPRAAGAPRRCRGARAVRDSRSASARSCPAPVLGNAYLEAARLHERVGHARRTRSPHYSIAATLFGAAADTRAAATRALARLGAR